MTLKNVSTNKDDKKSKTYEVQLTAGLWMPGYKIFPVWKLGLDKKIHLMNYEFTITEG